MIPNIHHYGCPCSHCANVNNGMNGMGGMSGVNVNGVSGLNSLNSVNVNGINGLTGNCGEKRYLPEPIQNNNCNMNLCQNDYYNAFSSNQAVDPFGIYPSALYQPSHKRVRVEPATNNAIYGQPQCQFTQNNVNQNFQFDEHYRRNPIQITLCNNAFQSTTNLGEYYNNNRYNNDINAHSDHITAQQQATANNEHTRQRINSINTMQNTNNNNNNNISNNNIAGIAGTNNNNNNNNNNNQNAITPSSTTVSDSTWNSMPTSYSNHSRLRVNIPANAPANVAGNVCLPANLNNPFYENPRAIACAGEKSATTMAMPGIMRNNRMVTQQQTINGYDDEREKAEHNINTVPIRSNNTKNHIVKAEDLCLPSVINHDVGDRKTNTVQRYVPSFCRITHNRLGAIINNNNNVNEPKINDDNQGNDDIEKPISMANSLVDSSISPVSNTRDGDTHSDENENNENTNNSNNNNLIEMDSLTDSHSHKIMFNTGSLKLPDKANKLPLSASCHQCKTKKSISILFYCTHKKHCVSNPFKTKKCRKKYCQSCMSKYFPESDVEKFKQFKDSLFWSFDCPSCQDVCNCKACLRRRCKDTKKKTKFKY